MEHDEILAPGCPAGYRGGYERGGVFSGRPEEDWGCCNTDSPPPVPPLSSV